MNKMRTQLFPYFVHAGLRHFGPGFSYDVYGVFDVEQFRKFLHSEFVFAIGHLNKFSKCLSEEISLKVAITSWSLGWRSGVVLGGGGGGEDDFFVFR
jgi:hypothetical protein